MNIFERKILCHLFEFSEAAKALHRSVSSFHADEVKASEPQLYSRVSAENADNLKGTIQKPFIVLH